MIDGVACGEGVRVGVTAGVEAGVDAGAITPLNVTPVAA